MKTVVALSSAVLLMSCPTWSKVEFRTMDLCDELKANDTIARGEIVRWDSPVFRELPLFPHEPQWWTPIVFHQTEAFRGDSTTEKTLLVAAPVTADGTLYGLPIRGATAWVFSRKTSDVYWTGIAEIGVIDGGVTFVARTFETEAALRQELSDAGSNPDCSPPAP